VEGWKRGNLFLWKERKEVWKGSRRGEFAD
jgi:hypothetical protein